MLIECEDKILLIPAKLVLVSYQKLFIHELLVLQNSFYQTPNRNTDSLVICLLDEHRLSPPQYPLELQPLLQKKAR